MRLIEWIPAPYRALARVLALALLAGLSAGGAWQVQDWRYGQALEKQARKSAEAATGRVEAVLATLAIEQTKRNALEVRLKTNDETHYKELSDAQKAQQRLADRLATADVRLSVLLATGPAGPGGDGVSAATRAGGVVHGGTRAELDPSHAQRIVGITGDGDRGLIALKACQGYVREVWASSQRPVPP
jgi:hypothetical protein